MSIQRYSESYYDAFEDEEGDFVKFEDHERELAALREELASAKADKDVYAQNAIDLRTSLDAVTFNLDKTDKALLAMQQRLTAAEQQNADVEKRAADLVECLWGLELPGAGNPRLRKLMRALTQPTESGASE